MNLAWDLTVKISNMYLIEHWLLLNDMIIVMHYKKFFKRSFFTYFLQLSCENLFSDLIMKFIFRLINLLHFFSHALEEKFNSFVDKYYLIHNVSIWLFQDTILKEKPLISFTYLHIVSKISKAIL